MLSKVECEESCRVLEESCIIFKDLEPIEEAIKYIKIIRESLAASLLVNEKIDKKLLSHYLLQVCALNPLSYDKASEVYLCFIRLKRIYIDNIYKKNKTNVDEYVSGVIKKISYGDPVYINKYEKVRCYNGNIGLSSDKEAEAMGMSKRELVKKIKDQHCAMLSVFPSEYLGEYEDVDE